MALKVPILLVLFQSTVYLTAGLQTDYLVRLSRQKDLNVRSSWQLKINQTKINCVLIILLENGVGFCFDVCGVVFLFVCFLLFSKTGVLCVAQGILELALQIRLPWNSEIHLSLPPQCWDQRHAPLHPVWVFVLTRSYCVIKARLELYIQVALQPVIFLPQPPKCRN